MERSSTIELRHRSAPKVRAFFAAWHRSTVQVWLAASVLALFGCQSAAPIHVWQPPQIESTVGKRVAVVPVVGQKDIAEKIHQGILESAPSDRGRNTTLVDTSTLQSKTEIQLVSAIDAQPSDVATFTVAKREGFDYLLRGELIADRRPQINNQANNHTNDAEPTLKVSWRLTPLSDTKAVSIGKPIVIDTKTATELYPDLAFVTDPQQQLISAAVRETLRLITPSLRRDQVKLASPRITPGSAKVREANVLATNGQWGEAEKIWQEVAQQHPAQVAAIHNLSLSAAARQDFSTAKQLARKAIRLRPTKLHKDTLLWIELRQREYHQSFNLPDPPEGWFVTSGK